MVINTLRCLVEFYEISKRSQRVPRCPKMSQVHGTACSHEKRTWTNGSAQHVRLVSFAPINGHSFHWTLEWKHELSSNEFNSRNSKSICHPVCFLVSTGQQSGLRSMYINLTFWSPGNLVFFETFDDEALHSLIEALGENSTDCIHSTSNKNKISHGDLRFAWFQKMSYFQT